MNDTPESSTLDLLARKRRKSALIVSVCLIAILGYAIAVSFWGRSEQLDPMPPAPPPNVELADH